MTGFYDISTIKDKFQFYKDAILHSYLTTIEIKDEKYRRVQCKDYTIKQMLDILNTKEPVHCVCIDRTIQYSMDHEGEVGFCTLSRKNDVFLLWTIPKN